MIGDIRASILSRDEAKRLNRLWSKMQEREQAHYVSRLKCADNRNELAGKVYELRKEIAEIITGLLQ